MFERFLATFELVPDAETPTAPWIGPRLEAVAGYRELSARFAGCSFERGLYRIHGSVTGKRAEQAIAEAFPSFADRATPFAFDWLGRHFAVDSARMTGGEPHVLLLEPGTGQALEIPCDLISFHNGELVDYGDAALAISFFDEWAASNPGSVPLSVEACVGYRVPLFLGGSDTVSNLEVVDTDVYWSISAQLLRGTATLPAGTSIAEITRRGR